MKGRKIMITKKQFDVLVYMAEHGGKATQRTIAKEAGISVGTVNKVLADLNESGLICDSGLTDKGMEVLEGFRVKRVVFIAAGFGSRLVPITLNTPKPLVRVKGQRIIDSLLDAVVKQGIEEIYIVRGYLGEQFDQLLYKYPMIKFIENPLYNEANNISSAYVAADLLKNAYVCEADLLLHNPAIITKYQYSSNYLAIPVEETDDWCFYEENGRISRVAVGGRNCHQMVGISYWTEEDGEQLKKDIPKVWNTPGGKERYWDQVPLEHCKDNYNVAIRQCRKEDIVEIDTFNELKQIDKIYAM